MEYLEEHTLVASAVVAVAEESIVGFVALDKEKFPVESSDLEFAVAVLDSVEFRTFVVFQNCLDFYFRKVENLETYLTLIYLSFPISYFLYTLGANLVNFDGSMLGQYLQKIQL